MADNTRNDSKNQQRSASQRDEERQGQQSGSRAGAHGGEFDNLSTEELRQKVQRLGIEGYSSMSKDELIRAVEEGGRANRR